MAAATSLSLSSNLAAANSDSASRKSGILLRQENTNSVSFRLPTSVESPLRVSRGKMLIRVCTNSAQVVMDNSASNTTSPAVVDGINFQVDSSVGGKMGINHKLGKNLIGAFYQPQCVLIDIDTLNTLPDRELASGLAEVIKYGLIRDADFFEWQEKNMKLLLARDPTAMTYTIKRSCENKAEVVSLDEREGGLRATLDLGHTFGHAIETGLGYGEWLHGEAVAAGTVMAVDMSYRLGWIDESLVKRVHKILTDTKLPKGPPESVTVETFKSVMAVDKKVADGLLRLILLKGPLGNCVFTGEYDRKALDDTLDAFAKYTCVQYFHRKLVTLLRGCLHSSCLG